MKKIKYSKLAILFLVIIPFLHVQFIQTSDDNDDNKTVVDSYSLNDVINKNMLFKAIDNEDYELVKYVITENPSLINCQDTEGSSPLFYAAGYGSDNIVELLLETGADANLADDIGDTPLRAAVDFNNYKAAQLLLRHGANSMRPNNKGEAPYDEANEEMKEILIAYY